MSFGGLYHALTRLISPSRFRVEIDHVSVVHDQREEVIHGFKAQGWHASDLPAAGCEW
jgi:hypothetical protein